MKFDLPIVVLLLVTAGGMSYRLGAPWVGQHDYASCLVSSMGRHHYEHGFAATRLTPLMHYDEQSPSGHKVYSHRPILGPILIALAYHVLGFSEGTARTVVITAALGGVLLLYQLMSHYFGRLTGWFAAAFFALAPANLYFGRVVSLTQLVLFFIILTTYAYFRWHESRKTSDFLFLIVALVLGLLTNWQAYYLCGILPLHHVLLARQSASYGKAAVIFLLGPILFAAFLAHLLILNPGEIDELSRTIRFRTGLMDAEQQLEFTGEVFQYSPWKLGTQMAEHARSLVRTPLVLLALGSLVACLVGLVRGNGERLAITVPLVLLAPAVCDTAIFHNVYFIHNYLVVFYLPGAAALGAVGMSRLLAERNLADPRVGLAVVISLVFIVGSVRETVGWHRFNQATPVLLGREIADVTLPGESMVLIGMVYHPGMEWYSNRVIYYLDLDGTIDEVIAAHEPRFVVVVKTTKSSIEKLKQTNPQRAEFLGTRFEAGLDYVRKHCRQVDQSQNLLIFERRD